MQNSARLELYNSFKELWSPRFFRVDRAEEGNTVMNREYFTLFFFVLCALASKAKGVLIIQTGILYGALFCMFFIIATSYVAYIRRYGTVTCET